MNAPAERFPESSGILLGSALCLHLAAIVYLPFGERLEAATCFVVGQFLAAMGLLRLFNGRWVFQDIRIFFALFLFLYGATLPLAALFGVGGETGGMANAAFAYGTAFLGFNLVQWWYRVPWRDVSAGSMARIRPTFSNAVVMLIAFILIGFYARSGGAQLGLVLNRRDGGASIGTQLWVVMMFLVNGFVMYLMVGWPALTARARWIVIASVGSFVLFLLSIGTRRDFLPMFVFLAGVVATRRRAVIRAGTVVVGFVAFTAMTAIGIFRQISDNPAILARFNPVELLVTQSEFVSPIQTLMHYTIVDRPLRWGLTYLSAPSLFLPRAFWPEKPESLSLQFMRDAFASVGLMGFAYTPVTEAFLNFGWPGPFIVFAILSIFLMKLVRNAELYPGLYFIVFAYTLDFNRGDFGGIFYSLVVVGTAYKLMQLVSRLRWAPHALRQVWPAPDRSLRAPASGLLAR
ncbi:MAG: hypothetical protein WKF55_06255 [Gemmatimonadaceae bacterium]